MTGRHSNAKQARHANRLAWQDTLKLVDQLRDIAFQRGQGFQSDADVSDARMALLDHIRSLAWSSPSTSATPPKSILSAATKGGMEDG